MDARQSPSGQRLAHLAAEVAGAATPRAALRRLPELRRELDAFERRQVALARADGASYAAIARDLGRSRQAVHRRFRSVAEAEPLPRVAGDVRRVLRHARDEAAALGAAEPDGDHVLLAVLQAGDLHASGVLKAAGVTLDRTRTRIEGMTPRGGLFRRDGGDPRGLLAASARAAMARSGSRIEVEDLLRAALDDTAGQTVRALGADPDAIRARLERRG